MQTVLITGGAGFIGSHLCDVFLEKGYKVIAVDSLLTGSKANISHLLDNSNFSFIQHDLTTSLPPLEQVDVILHFASPASPNKDNPVSYINYPVETMLVNSYANYLLLEKAKEWGARFVYASTSEIYGDPLEHPQKESYLGNVSSTGVRSCYDEGKRFGEAMTQTYFRKFGVDTRIVRIFNTYGPRMPDDGRVVVNFIKSALTNTPVTIFGDGSQTRSFCYVDDLVSGIIKLAELESLNGEVINLGNPTEFTIEQLAQELEKILGSKLERKNESLPEDDPKKRQPDITKAKTLLHWKPKIPLAEGLPLTLQYFKNK